MFSGGSKRIAVVLERMGWTIFLTSLGPDVSFSALLETYGLRWHIEVIFQAWKSQMAFHVIRRVSALRYLARYVHKSVVSEPRLQGCDKSGNIRLSPDEILRRWSQHVLPEGLVRVRHHACTLPPQPSPNPHG